MRDLIKDAVLVFILFAAIFTMCGLSYQLGRAEAIHQHQIELLKCLQSGRSVCDCLK